MKRSMCGLLAFAAAAGLWACNGDPTDSIAGSGLAIQADPSSLFIPQGGDPKAIIVEVTDAQGNELDITDLQFQAATADILVEEDTSFLPTSAGTLETSRRLIVTGISPAATSISLTTNGLNKTIPVKVTPSTTTVTLSTATPAANEPLVITLPAGYKFGTGAGANIAGAAGAVVEVAPDSSSITVLLPPGATGPVTVDSVAVDFAPGVLFSLPTTDVVTVGAATPLAGTDDPSTAPTIALPAIGAVTRFFDAPNFTASPDAFYKITVPAEVGTVNVTLNWNGAADIDLIAGPLSCATTFTACDFSAATAAHPEVGAFTLAPGTYYIFAELFAGAAPSWIFWEITTAPPEAL
jgi:hypothetical protein